MIKNLAIGSGSNRTLLLLALLLGVISAVLVGVYLSSLDGDEPATTPVATKLVVVAAQDIPALTRISEEMLTVKAIPVDLALAGAFTKTEDAVGQTAQTAIVVGEQVMQSKITSPDSAQFQFGANAPLSLVIPDGKRAFSVSLSSVAAAGGLIRAGDHVDLILSGDPVAAPEQGTLTPGAACYVLQNVEVLAMDTAIKQTVGDADAAGIAATEAQPGASMATLSVSPEEAWQLAAVQKTVSGGGVERQLWVSLRPFGDTTVNAGLPTCQTIAGS